MAPGSILGASWPSRDRKSTRLNSSHTVIYTLSLHDALPISNPRGVWAILLLVRWALMKCPLNGARINSGSLLALPRSEEHTSELQSHRDLHSFLTRRSSDLKSTRCVGNSVTGSVGSHEMPPKWRQDQFWEPPGPP